MSGYRQSSYDPDTYEQLGPALRPYSGVQWLGVVLVAIGLLLYAAHFAALFGWIEPLLSRGSVGFLPAIIGFALINSRRAPNELVGPEQRAANRRTLLITLAVVAVLLGLAAVLEFSGAV